MSAVRRASSTRAMAYAPLVMHLIPTLGIGYFVVIPQSCIAGVNELTIGFAVANLGFVLSYVAGLRIAAKQSGGHA